MVWCALRYREWLAGRSLTLPVFRAGVRGQIAVTLGCCRGDYSAPTTTTTSTKMTTTTNTTTTSTTTATTTPAAHRSSTSPLLCGQTTGGCDYRSPKSVPHTASPPDEARRRTTPLGRGAIGQAPCPPQHPPPRPSPSVRTPHEGTRAGGVPRIFFRKMLSVVCPKNCPTKSVRAIANPCRTRARELALGPPHGPMRGRAGRVPGAGRGWGGGVPLGPGSVLPCVRLHRAAVRSQGLRDY